MLAALLLLPLALQVSAETYTLYHRFLPKGEYTPRGTVSIEDGVATFATEPVKAGQSESPWYQVALDVGGDMVTSSTRACFADDEAQLTISLSAGDRPTGVEYKPLRIPSDGECASVKARSLPSSDVTVVLAKPGSASSPALSAPPVIAESGEEVKPEREKTLLEKYWMPITIVFVMMFLAGGSDDQPANAKAPAA